MEVREASKADVEDFVNLVLMASPYFPELFGPNTELMLKEMFVSKSNLFSFEHVRFIRHQGKNAGMLLSYSWRENKKESLKTGFLMLRFLGFFMIRRLPKLLVFNKEIGQLPENSYYISNVAVFPQFRGKGFGKKLIELAEISAAEARLTSLVLDVERENSVAVNLYKKLKFKKLKEFTISLSKKSRLNFFRMIKVLSE